ncbi:MAG: LamG-like jellyroll fold domain-containing protein, partial [Emticicia sp.]|uniref:LamG-like jellyroll fold domain-containing protein n=1 Tax=Emticicia sp. TaxID=1930953 RepID=UPI003BA4DEAD
MKPFIKWVGGLLLMVLSLLQVQAQTDTLCDPNENKKIFGELYFNYGSVTNAFSEFNRSTFVVGQPLASPRNMLSQQNQAGFGIYSPWFLPPQPPILIASQGDFKDRIKVAWNVNPLSTPPTGFILYRDGSFLADLGEDVREFLDFNTQAGEFYEYSIVAKNIFGTGSPSKFVGFVNPNGVVSGKVETNSGNPVPGVEVRLTPLTGNSMAFDGVNDELCVTYNDEFPTDKFTVSAYVKLGDTNNETGIIDWGSTINKNWWITTTPSNEAKGFIFHIGNGTGSDSLKYYFPTVINPFNANEWHQITMVYNGSAMSVMVDGEFVGTKPASIVREKNYLNIGSKIGNDGFFKGKIDDIRVYNRPLTQTEVNSTKNRSVSKSENGLVSYWKMDEGIGVKVFDNTTIPTNANVFGATFSSDKPEVYSAGVTDVTGYYVIDGVNYSQNEGFRATPMKNFEFNSSLEFNAADKSYGNLTDFDMPDTSTVQILFYPFDLKSRQTVLSKGSLYEAYINNGKLFLNLNGTTTDLGAIKAKFYHLAVTLDNTAGTANIYLEGELKGTVSFTGVSNWRNGSPWLLATNSTNAATGKFYTGLVDEFVIYKTALPQNVIQEHYVVGLPKDSTTALQWSYFDLNEATDTKVFDYAAINFGAVNPREGIIVKASWSNNARRKETKAHEFEPNVRVVNLNTSNTAVGNIDFKDVSTVNVSGYVRFANTFCFEDKVEILVNGQSNFPQIYTDKDGKWSADFEPGKTIKLSASYKDHVFGPSFFEIRKIQAPRAGIIFLDNTKRVIRGQIAGGECRQSILPVRLDPTAYQVLKVESTNGCFSKVDTLRNPDGKYVFDNLPAIAFETKYLFHSYDNSIKDYFNNKGGQQTDLRDVPGDTLDFVYISQPQVRIDTSKILFNKCDQLFAYQTLSDPNKKLKVKFQTFENYYGGECIVDSVKYTVNNDIGDRLQEEFQSDSTAFLYESTIGVPNILEPYTKKLQVTANYKGSIATNTINVIVFGMLSRPASFTTSANANPYMILRDPPGDQSTATIEKGTTSCASTTRVWANSVGATIASEWTIGEIKKVVAAPLGIGVIEETGTETKIKLSSTNTYTNTGEEVMEVCVTTLKSISTSTDLVGRDGDIFAGNGMNFKMGLNDRISLGPDSCSVKADTLVWVSPNGFNTEFIYTRHHIMTDVIPSLTIARNAATDPKERAKFQTSLDNWRKIMIMDSLLLAKTDEGKENISFDAGVNYTKSITTSAVKSLSTTHEFSSENSLEIESNFEIPFLRSELSGGVTYSHGETWAEANSTTNEVTFSYNLADDDIGDNFSVDIAQFVTIPTGQTDMDELNKRRTEKFSSIEYSDALWSKTEIDSLERKINELINLARQAEVTINNKVRLVQGVPSLIEKFERKKFNPGKEMKIYPLTAVERAEYEIKGFAGNFPSSSDREAFKRFVRRDRKLSLPEFVSPSFTLVAGESMCPWEGSMTINETTGETKFEGTLNREQVSLTVDKNVQINVPKNTPAVYHLKLGNLGSAIKDQDQLTYKLGLVSGTNPRGAVVKVNGFNITEAIPFVLNSREVLDATLTIERGPEDFSYQGIKVAFFSECEVGVPNQNSKDDIAPLFYQEVSLDAYFVEPCSEVDIAFPLQNFVLTPADLDKQSISLIEYDKNDPDLKDIIVQYRRVDGDGAWINIQKFLPDELAPLQTNLIWNTELLRDDFYEIRAITSCNNASLAPGISTIVRGKLEREAPVIVGVPEPGDGTWDPGDEISITFNEAIDCDKVIQADILANNTIGLYDATTNALVDARITCVGNKIVIVPNINPVFFENRTFRVQVSGKDYDDAMIAQNPNHIRAAIRDKAGNMIEKTIKWEFAVNQNNLEWVGTDIMETNEVLKPFSVKRQIRNRGGSIASFRMESVPSWLTVSPSTGTLNPGQVADVTLTFQQDLLIGDYLDTLQMVGSRGREPLLIDYRVRCPQPNYVVDNPAQYEGSMNMVIDLKIFGVKSKDPSDVVVAKIGGQVRGVGRVQYYRNIPTEGTNPSTGLPDDSNRWLTFLTIYGNSSDIDKPIEFAIWDGDKCNEYVEVLEQISYEEGGLVGSPLEPQPINVLNLV